MKTKERMVAMRKNKYRCAICGKEHTSIELQMPNGVAVCLGCAKDIYSAIYALKALIKCESPE